MDFLLFPPCLVIQKTPGRSLIKIILPGRPQLGLSRHSGKTHSAQWNELEPSWKGFNWGRRPIFVGVPPEICKQARNQGVYRFLTTKRLLTTKSVMRWRSLSKKITVTEVYSIPFCCCYMELKSLLNHMIYNKSAPLYGPFKSKVPFYTPMPSAGWIQIYTLIPGLSVKHSEIWIMTTSWAVWHCTLAAGNKQKSFFINLWFRNIGRGISPLITILPYPFWSIFSP